MNADLSRAIVPKSDQLNADDLIAGPRTITVSRVAVNPGAEQPVSIFFEGDDGKPWKPCKSMCRVLVAAWGMDGANYAGRSITLYRDPAVKWGGMAVGGIRISHLSHIAQKMVMALTETKGSRKPFTVNPLPPDILAQIAAAQTIEDLERLRPTMRGNAIALAAAKTRAEAIRAATNQTPDPLTAAQAALDAATTPAEVKAVWESLSVEEAMARVGGAS